MARGLSVITNVITGFLGAGKSTAILHLLKHKPPDERWAVLVNEFGEVGIDGSLLQGREGEEQGVFVREVPGGCMCCAAGLPMQVALTTLLSRGRPDRLLIEPTGLGHPEEVLELLGSKYYRNALDLRATITLVDARKVHDARYTEHPTFVQQLAVADVVVANKTDQYGADDLPALRSFLERTDGLAGKPLFEVERGALDLQWLAVPGGRSHAHGHAQDHDPVAAEIPVAPEIPEAGYLRIDNEGEGFLSQGWIFDPSWIFDEEQLHSLLLGVDAERVKAVFLTEGGVTAFNMVDGVLTKSSLDESADSRVEVISSDPGSFVGLEEALLGCVLRR